MPRLTTISVELNLPFLGKISGQWAPEDAERVAAWEMYVELATRISTQPLGPDEGLIREAFNSYYSLFGTTRSILREHGPRIAKPSEGGDLSFGYLALAVLNGALRPLLTRWHPELLAHEQQRPPSETVTGWERRWEDATAARQQIEVTRQSLLEYADLLAEVAGVTALHARD